MLFQKPAVPVFASKPRFMGADPTDTSEKVHMLPPDESKHDTFLYVHPVRIDTNTMQLLNRIISDS